MNIFFKALGLMLWRWLWQGAIMVAMIAVLLVVVGGGMWLVHSNTWFQYLGWILGGCVIFWYVYTSVRDSFKRAKKDIEKKEIS